MTPLLKLIDDYGAATFDLGEWQHDTKTRVPYITVMAAQESARQAMLAGVESLQSELSLRNDELQALRYTIVATIGGVDYEGLPTCDLNYLQRLRILVEKEASLLSAQQKIEELQKQLVEAKFESQFALKLKDLGFDERFLASYRDQKMLIREQEQKIEELEKALTAKEVR